MFSSSLTALLILPSCHSSAVQLYVLVDKLITMVITTALVNIMDYADNSIYRELILRICEDVELAIIMLIRLNIR